MFDLSEHPYFEQWQDPESGVVSFLLKERVAPVQQSFYFTNPSVSADEHWMWFYTAFPPNRQRTLALVCLDPARPVIRHYPQAGFTAASPMVAPEGDAVYFCMANSVYRLDREGETRIVCSVPLDYIGKRHYDRIATHLTLSADGKYLLLDGDLGNFWWVGLGSIDTGEVTILKEFGQHHNHAQFSPVEPDLFLIPEDWWNDKISGRHFAYDHRLWLMDIGQKRYEAVSTGDWYDHTGRASHEWWSNDGMVCWNDYERGTYECDPHSLEATHVWKRALCHAHCSRDRRYWCADESPYKWQSKPVEILFYDRQSRRETAIVSAMPAPPLDRNLYHLDPHPQFSPRDSWIVYTTTVRGHVDVALSPVEALGEKAG